VVGLSTRKTLNTKLPPRLFGVLHANKGANMENIDVVGEFVGLKKELKGLEEKLSALETIIFSDKNLRQDERIKIVSGRKTIVIKKETYKLLESIGIETNLVETRKKKFDEFDIEVQKNILKDSSSYEEKTTKESLRIK
jgi:hypothetical protein